MPLRTLLALGIALPAALAAQAPSTAAVRAALLADWGRDRANALALVDAMPEAQLAFRPTPGVRTFAEQVQHAVSENVAAIRQVLPGTSPAPAVDTAAASHHKAALRAWVAGAYDWALARIRTADDAGLARTSSLYRYPAQLAWRWLALAHEHGVWTLGQTVPYLRLAGARPAAYQIPF